MSASIRLRELADRYGLAPGFYDLAGQWHAPDDSTLAHILEALNIAARTDDEARASLRAATRGHTQGVLPPVVVLQEHDEPRITLTSLSTQSVAADTSGFAWQLVCEDGRTVGGNVDADALGPGVDGRVVWSLPAQLACGYHDLSVTTGADVHATCRVIVTPARAFQPEAVLGEQRTFGIMLQLYSVRSRDNWGIGDLRDVRSAIDVFAPLGVGFIGLNPLHAGFLSDPARCSPYSPSNRRLLNPLYVAVDELEDFSACAAAQSWFTSADVQARLRAVREAELVDYVGVAQLKLEAFEFAYRHYKRTCGQAHPRHAEFAAFTARQGAVLADHTQWEAASGGEGVRAEPEFFAYLQWQTERALDAVCEHAKAAGMPVGLYMDLAVGVAGDGGEVSASSSLFATGVSLGAPPDDFSPTGQTWALPPWNPHALRAAGYEPFCQMLRAAMRASGALRIDHVMGLLRQFWVPDGASAVSGAYVAFPVHDLLAIVALESCRNRCVVVGEDLGTVPDEMRELLHEHGLLSYRVLFFERYWHGDESFKKPWDFPADALVTVATHDLPTLAGYFSCHDLRLRHELGKLPSHTSYEQQRAHREWECGLLRRALDEEGFDSHALVESVHGYVARTPCKLMAVQIEDLLGIVEQVNLPDTVDEHPNWRRRIELPVEAWAADEAIRDVCAVVRGARAQ